MTFRFELAERIRPDALKQAWDKTLTVYPYMSYAVVARNGKLIMTENPLPFVFSETGEVVEPFERSGNFHTVTFCYLGRTLWVYADHVATDGTGFRFVLETFFYHYYCLVDGVEYSVPEGVFSEKDGAVPGQEEDAYLMADAVDAASLSGSFIAEDSFELQECQKDGIFVNKADCRAYCMSVPSKEMMGHAKKVGGSPMSILAVAFARALQRVHPENTLPIRVNSPVSIRKAMGNNTSIRTQAVMSQYNFNASDLVAAGDEELNKAYRGVMKEFVSEQNIRMLCGVYRGICEGNAKALSYGALDKISMEQRGKAGASVGVSYVGTLRTGEYGNRIRMTAFHVMDEKGIMLQTAEIGDTFYIGWYQGFHDAAYILAMRDVMEEAGMQGIDIERIE